MVTLIILALLFFTIWFCYMFFKFRNPYRLILVIGKKGAGKTTLLTKIAIDNVKKGRNVYSTVKLPYTRKLSIQDIGIRSFPPDSVILVDESGTVWDNRHFKNFSSAHRDFFKAQRHNKLRVYLFSQCPDVDKKIRDLTDRMYLLTNPFNFCSLMRSITRNITVTDAKMTGESNIVDQLHISGFFGFLTGSTKFLYIPKYTKYFDSFEKIDDLRSDQITDADFWMPEYTSYSLRKKRLPSSFFFSQKRK